MRFRSALTGSLAFFGGGLFMSTPRPAETYSPIIELRQYTLRAHKRDVLIDMFDTYFVEPQEAEGINVVGQFRNLDDPNKFVWVRGFPNMQARATSLAAFYGGPAWKAHRTAANETIIDNDNVLLLRPVHPESGFNLGSERRPPSGKLGDGPGIVTATIYHLDPTAEKQAAFVAFFETTVAPLLVRAGAPVIASFVPELSSNTFPGLPVREGEHVFVWFSRFRDVAALDQFNARLANLPLWRDSVGVELSAMVREPQTLRLKPSARSLLHQ